MKIFAEVKTKAVVSWWFIYSGNRNRLCFREYRSKEIFSISSDTVKWGEVDKRGEVDRN